MGIEQLLWGVLGGSSLALRWAALPILGELRRREPGRSRLADFETKAKELGWPESNPRYALALKRIVAPFSDAEDSGVVERMLNELSPTELTSYLGS